MSQSTLYGPTYPQSPSITRAPASVNQSTPRITPPVRVTASTQLRAFLLCGWVCVRGRSRRVSRIKVSINGAEDEPSRPDGAQPRVNGRAHVRTCRCARLDRYAASAAHPDRRWIGWRGRGFTMSHTDRSIHRLVGRLGRWGAPRTEPYAPVERDSSAFVFVHPGAAGLAVEYAAARKHRSPSIEHRMGRPRTDQSRGSDPHQKKRGEKKGPTIDQRRFRPPNH